jgi:hypothetical protein
VENYNRFVAKFCNDGDAQLISDPLTSDDAAFWECTEVTRHVIFGHVGGG